MELAPIALFVYNRPEHTRRTVEALATNEIATESDLFIFSDGPKKPAAEAAVAEVREYVKSITGFRSVTVTERQENYGLARSVITGVAELVSRFGRIIVVEDDLVTSKGFLSYMNLALEKYADEDRIMQISGHVFPFKPTSNENDAFFMSVSTSWGWATWRRAWDSFDSEVKECKKLLTDKRMRRAFDLDGAIPYAEMLKGQIEGKVDSWAIRWWWTVFTNDGLCLYPRKSLVLNIGFDEMGTHTKDTTNSYNDSEWTSSRYVDLLPSVIQEDLESFVRFKKFNRTKSLIFFALLETIKTYYSKLVCGL